ncbi:energy-coupling factor ABC transporter permease [Aeromicrobium wangtongii]|uniref:energy-coupling factor ABC transporter permease n=1 Tax=Aeromicrobium wangtongii TaxID=2969247 RepID=UPI002017E467|nr:energy-coupling factor ABC transporter permease [Aeromicrobium wangtongii]MCL3817665.1 energy-coupling factor ABC transporter permease [Aeromicrobium wangtongii]
MHIPDGFIDGPTALGGAAVAAVGLTYAARRASVLLDDKHIPLAGLTAAFIFAMQMINFPVASGTSGHLLGGALAAILVGPWVATICTAIVLVAQSLLFADGGVTAIGLNLVDMALLGPLLGYLAFLGVRRVLPGTTSSVLTAAGVAGFVGMMAAVLGFVGMYAIGATTSVPLGAVAGAMIGVHLVIAALEAFLTVAILASVLSIRPDLVHGARDLVVRQRAAHDTQFGKV